MYITSDKIKFYPSAYRYYVDNNQTHVVNPEASKNTEYNLTSQLAKLFHSTKGCFIVEDNGTNIEFFIGGYYTKINNYATSLLSSFSSDNDVYANLRVALFTPNPNDEGFTDLYEVVPFGTPSNKPLDSLTGCTVYFEGIKFDTSVDANATFSLHLFTKKNGTFVSVDDSKYPITLDDILGNTGKKASDEIKTKVLRVTDTIYGVNGTFTGDISAVNLTLSGDATIQQDLNVSGSIYIGDVKLSENQDHELVLENSVQFAYQDIDMGTSVIPLNSLYVQDIHLGHSLVPLRSGVTLGVSNNRFGTLYNTKVDTNGIDLRGNLIPYGNVNLGDTSNTLTDGYFSGSLYSGSCYSNHIYGNSTTLSYITLHKALYPYDNTINLGSSSKKYSNVYATTFNGALSGNASTATKLNGTSVGGVKQPVYFSNGNPIVTNYNEAFYTAVQNLHMLKNTDSVTIYGNYMNPRDVSLGGGWARNCIFFVTINFNGDRCTAVFFRKTNAANSNEFNIYNYTYRLHFDDLDDGSIPYKTRVTFQWKNSSNNWEQGNESMENISILYFPVI